MTWPLADYTEIGRLGSGATGTVASARHEPTGTIVAIKFLQARRHGRYTLTDWFRTQVKLLAEVDNQHVARLYEYIESPSGGALVTELVDGVSLEDLIREAGPIEPPAALAILRGSLIGLAAAHERGLWHRDFRPANVEISRGGVPKIVDFGVVPPVEAMRPSTGTPLYQAPELWNRKHAGPRSDLYAATASFVECLTGRPPYPPTKTMAEMRQLHETAPIPLSDIPEPLRDLVRRGLAKDPADRPASAVALLEAVEHVAAMRYGTDWERMAEAALIRRLLPLLPPPGRALEIKTPQSTVRTLASSLATRVLVGAAAAAAIVILVDAGIAAAGPTANTAGSDNPTFTVVLPQAPGSGNSVPSATPTLLIIPTPGVTLTAPAVPGARAGRGVPTLSPPVGANGHPTTTRPTTKPPGGGSTTTPPGGGSTTTA